MHLWLRPDWVPSFELVDAWAWGILYMVVISRLFRGPPEHQITRGLKQIQRNSWTNLDTLATTKDVIAPLLVSLLVLILAPAVVFEGMRYSTQLSSKMMYTHFYPGALIAMVLAVSLRLSYETLVLKLREKEYLIEAALNNYEAQ
ncbi:hypothetical protein AAF712_003946 [Marasmius tenuissimus]|uniref:RING-type E3 ubiquitin transferase n=1 Tax=Marasmius tenuissimus TaxID=585030 RepID=A0ABR3A5M6_9AGAR